MNDDDIEIKNNATYIYLRTISLFKSEFNFVLCTNIHSKIHNSQTQLFNKKKIISQLII